MKEVFADGFTTHFSKEEEFLSFLKERKENATWKRKKSNQLKLFDLDKMEGRLLEKFGQEGLNQEIINDTAANTGLVLRVKDELYPIRDCAIKTILDRAGISGPVLNKLEKNVYARILNYCLQVAKGESLLHISDGKVSAVLGGDSHDYAILDMEEIYKLSIEYLHKNFQTVSYLGGFYEHSIVSSLWEIQEPGLVDAYKKELWMYDKEPEEMSATIRISTSNVGTSGANIYPILLHGSQNEVIPLGSPIRLAHKGNVTINTFKQQLGLIYGKYQFAIGKLSNLLHIDIVNPINCMMEVIKRLNIPKKLGMEAIELFKAQNGEEPCTAHEIYYGLSEILFMLECSGTPGSKITKMEETISRTLGLNWEDYDIPGECKW